ncbi:MAG: diphthine--ammonia ligase [Bacteroidia bacterium]
MKTKALFCWSGGKDSAMALYQVMQEGEYEVAYLLTTINENFKRISMHGVREEMLEKQVEAIGIPLIKMYVKEGNNDEYEQNMEKILLGLKKEGIEYVIFGDIFLEDLRRYREKNMDKAGMKTVFPLWKKNTAALMKSFFSLKFKTITCCVNDAWLNEEQTGAEVDAAFVRDLPPEVDPCGENGEFHTFCFDGPLFKHPVLFSTGEKVYRPLEVKTDNTVCHSDNKTKGFWFCDLIPLKDGTKTV